MRAYSFWVFDRHCNVIYHQDWSQLHQKHAASAPSFTSSLSSTLQRVGGGSTDADKGAHAVTKRARGEAMHGVSRSVSANKDDAIDASLLPFDEEAKLIYGVVYSLRNMVRKLGGTKETFHNISTSTYTLTHMQTPSMYTFVLITDPTPVPAYKPATAPAAYTGTPGTSAIPDTNAMNLRGVVRELWRGPWIKFASHHPLVDATERNALGPGPSERVERTHGIDNNALHSGVERVLMQYKLLPMV